jgi:hypothetical protein
MMPTFRYGGEHRFHDEAEQFRVDPGITLCFAFMEKRWTLQASRGGHDDLVIAVMLAYWAGRGLQSPGRKEYFHHMKRGPSRKS